MVARMFALPPVRLLVFASSVVLLACGDDGGREDEASAGGSNSDPSGISVGTVPTEATGGGGISVGGDDTGMKLDLPAESTDSGFPGNGGDCNGNGMENDYEFSIIWISNSGEGTVSKIDTEAAVEVARYRTGPIAAPDPSRTSVNLRGDVAVANRSGSITKIAANPMRCVDKNGNGTIDTSQSGGDVRAWGEDECVLWHHDLGFPQGLDSNQGGPRAVAWDAGDPAQCYLGARVWIGWRDQPNAGVKLRRLDGDTGVEQVTVDVPDWQCNWGHGTYGGAIDKDGAFWGLGTLQTLVRVDPQSLAVDRWEGPGGVVYGIAIDKRGTPWLGGWDGQLWHFDRDTAAFVSHGVVGPGRLRGLMIDKQGHAWLAGNDPCALVRFDTEAGQVVDGNIALPGCSEPVGVSIDRDAYVWVVDRAANRAYKVDPDTYGIVTVEGLVAPYTYSDMTGAGLDLVVNPPVD